MIRDQNEIDPDKSFELIADLSVARATYRSHWDDDMPGVTFPPP